MYLHLQNTNPIVTQTMFVPCLFLSSEVGFCVYPHSCEEDSLPASAKPHLLEGQSMPLPLPLPLPLSPPSLSSNLIHCFRLIDSLYAFSQQIDPDYLLVMPDKYLVIRCVPLMSCLFS
jgi:hypothetical protein